MQIYQYYEYKRYPRPIIHTNILISDILFNENDIRNSGFYRQWEPPLRKGSHLNFMRLIDVTVGKSLIGALEIVTVYDGAASKTISVISLRLTI